MKKTLFLGAALMALALPGLPLMAQILSAPPANRMQQVEMDPSSRVGRFAVVEGLVTARSDAGADAVPVGLNWPVTAGLVIRTGRESRTEIQLGSTVFQLNGATELVVERLNDAQMHLRLNFGSIGLQVTRPEQAGELFIRTPQGSLQVTQATRLRLDTELIPDTTAVSVFTGAVQFDALGSNFQVRPGKRLEIAQETMRSLPVRMDSFDHWAESRAQFLQSQAGSMAARYVSPEMSGVEELDRYGDWRVTEEAGPVWIPRAVGADWVPYRDGRWTWIAPWGWTWIDNAPWGYAPSHYGRWMMVGSRWAWAPGRVVARPVWAPAVVGWAGGGHTNVSISVGTGPQVGWFPLGPGEAYVPHYRVSARHIEQLNESHFGQRRPGETQVYVAPSAYRFASKGITLLPQNEFNAGSRNVIIHERVMPAREPMSVREQQLREQQLREQQTRMPVAAEPRLNDTQRWQRGADRYGERNSERNSERAAERNDSAQSHSRQSAPLMPGQNFQPSSTIQISPPSTMQAPIQQPAVQASPQPSMQGPVQQPTQRAPQPTFQPPAQSAVQASPQPSMQGPVQQPTQRVERERNDKKENRSDRRKDGERER